jgi:hypothetical protein
MVYLPIVNVNYPSFEEKKNINNLATQQQNNVQIRSIWELNSTKGFDIELMTEITMSHDEEVIIVAIRWVN